MDTGWRNLEIGVAKQPNKSGIQQFCPLRPIQTDFLSLNYIDVSKSDSGVKIGFVFFLQCASNEIHCLAEILPTFVAIVSKRDKTLSQVDVFFSVFRCKPVIWPFGNFKRTDI